MNQDRLQMQMQLICIHLLLISLSLSLYLSHLFTLVFSLSTFISNDFKRKRYLSLKFEIINNKNSKEENHTYTKHFRICLICLLINSLGNFYFHISFSSKQVSTHFAFSICAHTNIIPNSNAFVDKSFQFFSLLLFLLMLFYHICARPTLISLLFCFGVL